MQDRPAAATAAATAKAMAAEGTGAWTTAATVATTDATVAATTLVYMKRMQRCISGFSGISPNLLRVFQNGFDTCELFSIPLRLTNFQKFLDFYSEFAKSYRRFPNRF